LPANDGWRVQLHASSNCHSTNSHTPIHPKTHPIHPKSYINTYIGTFVGLSGVHKYATAIIKS